MSKTDITPIAVALRYEGINAPVVSASGSDELAEKILGLAKEHDVPVFQDPVLCKLLARVDLNSEIPEFLYLAVAEIIAFSYRLKAEAAYTLPAESPRPGVEP